MKAMEHALYFYVLRENKDMCLLITVIPDKWDSG
jgi:hypothetical protein